MQTAVVCLLVAAIYKLLAVLLQLWNSAGKSPIFPVPDGHWLMGHILMVRHSNQERLRCFRLQRTSFVFFCLFFFQVQQDESGMEQLIKWGKQYPYAFTVRLGPIVKFLYIHHPDYAKTFLTSSVNHGRVSFLRHTLTCHPLESSGDGLVLLDDDKWLSHRKLLNPAFRIDILKPYVKVMSQAANTMLDKLERYSNTGESFEICEHMTAMTMDIIMNCAFCSKKKTVRSALQELADIGCLRFRNPLYHNKLLFHLSPLGFSYRRACKGHNQAGLTNEEVQAEVKTFMVAGHESTSVALSFIFYTLACNPEHQKICREEVTQVLGDKDTVDCSMIGWLWGSHFMMAIVWEDLANMPYTTMCIKESLRLYPPVPVVSRKLTKPMTFFDGRTLPEGSLIALQVYALHRNATVWENPDLFDPLRFLPDNVCQRSPHAFVPFSAGLRNCIGQSFAMNEIKVVVALMLKRYQLIEDPTKKPRLLYRIVLRPKTGIHIQIKPLDA
uniref:Cytochrome P450, family 4, subfamily T, polypeptide 8 n=1 Tax=Hippocampus comes TaxID=109280 RepID=A0A3Q3E0W4_HIPCM